MHTKIDILLDWEINTLENYFQKNLDFYIQEISVADDTLNFPKLSNKYLAIGAFGYFRQSVLYELNALVEHYLLMGADDGSGLLSNENLKRSRAESIKTISVKYKIDISNLPGYTEVKKLYSTVNALKHRGGFDFTNFSRSIPEFKRVDDNIETLKLFKDASFKFVKELVNSILLIERKQLRLT